MSAKLEARIAQGELKSDARQRLAAAALDNLAHALKIKLNFRANFRHRLLNAIMSYGVGYGANHSANHSANYNAPPKNRTRSSGLYLYGGVGRGKTMLMDAFHQTVQESLGTHQSLTSRRHFVEFMADVHGTLANYRRDAAERRVLTRFAREFAARCRVLCLDEMIIDNVADAMMMSSLFTSLLKHGVVVVVTSNFAPEELYENGLQRARFLPFIKLLEAQLDVVKLDGAQDYRRPIEESPEELPEESLEESSSETWARGLSSKPASASARQKLGSTRGLGLNSTRWLAPPNRATRRQFFRTFRACCLMSPQRVSVGKIKMQLSGPAGMASFRQLCIRPRGAHDYLKLASRFSEVFIYGIPLLGDERIEWALRFRNLIDVLYDKEVSLFALAEAMPEHLISARHRDMSLERLRSRLAQMSRAPRLPAYDETDRVNA